MQISFMQNFYDMKEFEYGTDMKSYLYENWRYFVIKCLNDTEWIFLKWTTQKSIVLEYLIDEN